MSIMIIQIVWTSVTEMLLLQASAVANYLRTAEVRQPLELIGGM